MNSMSKWIGRALVAGTVLSGFAATAEEGQWTLKLGASYRAFDDFKFGPANLPGSGTSADPAGPFGIQDLTPAQPGLPLVPHTITVDVVDYAGADVEVDGSSGFAPYLGAEYVLSEEDNCAWVLSLGFQYFNVEGDSPASTTGVTSTTTTLDVLPIGGVPTIVPPAVLEVDNANPPFTVAQDYEVDLYVLDLGVKGTYDAGAFTFGVGGGPTLNFIETSSSQAMVSTAAAIPGGTTAGTALPAGNDDDSDVSLGLYFGLDVAVELTDTLGVGLGYRYDWVDKDAETAQGGMDLSSHSFQLSFQIDF